MGVRVFEMLQSGLHLSGYHRQDRQGRRETNRRTLCQSRWHDAEDERTTRPGRGARNRVGRNEKLVFWC